MNIPYEKYLLSVLFLLFVLVPFRAANKTDLSNELESALKLRNQYSLRKEARIDSLKRLLYPSMDDNERFRLYNAIYEEYYTYRFDSAMLYVDKEEQVAMTLSHLVYRNLSIIHRSVLLSTSGYFSESIQNLEQIDSRTLNDATQIEYYAAYEWAYSMWAEYSNDKVYAPVITKKKCFIRIHCSVYFPLARHYTITGKEKIYIVTSGTPKRKSIIKRHWKAFQ